MANSQKYKNKKIAIYGLGKSGFSAAKRLTQMGAEVFCWDDSSTVRKKIKRFNLKLIKFWLIKNYYIDYIVISPGIDINKCKIKNFLKKNINKIITDIDIFFEVNRNLPTISITGTNGKSTTCKIIEKILKTAGYKVHLLGNIGNPVLSLKKYSKNSIFILEVSSYQLQYSKFFRSKHAAILNISPDHLDRHKTINEYIKAKIRIFYAQQSSDYSYINTNSKYYKFIKNKIKRKKIKSKIVYVNNNKYKNFINKIKNRSFLSKGNIENFSFACEIVKNLNISSKIIVKSLKSFKNLPHRQEIVFSNKYMTCVNDSKATSFDASMQSLSIYNKIYLIIGGVPKIKDQFKLQNFYKKIVKVYIIGKKPLFFKKKISKNIPYIISHNLRNAIKDIYSDIKKSKKYNNTVLLSPSGASFDQFKNFEERGEVFKKLALKKLNKISYV